ncbi:MAG: prophage LambdaCh01, recombination protein Bet [Nitrospira sp.]|jgi:phage recombination protein Bet|nr:prophage LambdaCh01, recombination protein Bet [Nitrospira sp.]
MTTEVATVDPSEKKQIKLSMPRWTKAQLELLKRTVAKGTTDDEFSLFAYTCRRTGLDPFIKQIYAIKRWDPESDSFKMGIQVGIDGYRLVAHRTGKLCGIEPAEFIEDPDESWHPKQATVTVYAYDAQGEKRAYTHTVRWREYVQKKKDGTPVKMWSEKGMPYNQLGKCAEAGALRKAFPFDLSGILTHDEVPTIDIEVLSGDGTAQVEGPKQAETKSGDYYTGVLKGWAPKSATVKTHKFTFALDNNGGELTLSSFETPPALKAEKNPIGRRVQFQYEEKPNPRGGAPFRNLTHLAFEELTPEAEPEAQKPATDPYTGQKLPDCSEYLDLLESAPSASMLTDIWNQISKEIIARTDISKTDKGKLSAEYDELLAKLKKA